MNDDTINILEQFSEVLEITNPITFMLRWIGWIIIKGLAWLVDSLATITDSILGLKLFFQDSEITNLVEFLLPLSVILMAFSLAYTGYMLVFQKKMDREGIIVNIFMALVVLGLLGTAMDKANHFTDEAINALDVNTTSSISEKIVKDNLNDIAQYDVTSWTSPQLKEPNRIPENRILKINITESIDEDFKISSQDMSQESRDILSNRIQYDDVGSPSLVELDNGWFTAFKEKYYRWDWNFWTIAITLGVMAFTMLTIAIKMAKLFFELAFNYVLASIIAPADIHSGQKTKQVIQNILNIFVVTIMIFLSLKIYMIGTNFITQNFEGVAYLIALFAFSLAVIDGTNIVERLFGIDAGLKSGWSALAGGYALTRGATSTAKGAAQAVKGISSATKSAGVKGMGGLVGVAGMAQGLRSNTQNDPKHADRNNTRNSEKSSVNNEKQNPNSSDKKNANSQELNKNNSMNAATSEPTQDSFDPKSNEESPSGSGSSLEEEMQNQNQKQDEKSSANAQKYQGLHDDMGSKNEALNTSVNARIKLTVFAR
ncbi:pLS20_p028 family conjugation system transmembrane protein [Jeotgalibacillus proteolyticus]|uniref:DUF8208 domain-containing protein n=1 Tax=Jeotgalibacillus proteolyticus TaxID=2082395 RepID=A0A2S5G8F7_9BACL|nr:hypothetical protein [Jeotgalibacillus proteolyticus]PPA69201.1 hypothetical protein C4B60_18025 [Jeotgalibacillus proteolyticus]